MRAQKVREIHRVVPGSKIIVRARSKSAWNSQVHSWLKNYCWQSPICSMGPFNSKEPKTDLRIDNELIFMTQWEKAILPKNIGKVAFYSNLNFWEKLNIWSERSNKMQYIPDITFDILFDRISYVSFKPWNVQRLSANNFNKNQFRENHNGNFVQLNLMTIFITLYKILGITGGEIYSRFKAGSTVHL